MKYIKNKIGVGITTYNSEEYFKTLYKSIDNTKVNELVVVNGGEKYNNNYDCDWIQHNKNFYPAQSRNDCITYLLNRDCEHIFLIEDDMIIKNSDIFKKYIEASTISGLKYFSFVSTGQGSGSAYNRTPKTVVEYNNNINLSLYQNMCNEFTYHHCTVFNELGLYDPSPELRNAFDIDMAYREAKIGKWTTPFWWFPDISNSDDYIENNPNAQSRLQSDRPDGSRQQLLYKTFEFFRKKHNIEIQNIPAADKNEVIDKLRRIKNENSNRD